MNTAVIGIFEICYVPYYIGNKKFLELHYLRIFLWFYLEKIYIYDIYLNNENVSKELNNSARTKNEWVFILSIY